MLTKEELQAIRERCEEATLGPWNESKGKEDHIWSKPCDRRICTINMGAGYYDRFAEALANKTFIINARTDIPDLLDHIEEQTRKLHVYETALQKLSCLGAGSRQGNSDGNCMAQGALKDALSCVKESPCPKN